MFYCYSFVFSARVGFARCNYCHVTITTYSSKAINLCSCSVRSCKTILQCTSPTAICPTANRSTSPSHLSSKYFTLLRSHPAITTQAENTHCLTKNLKLHAHAKLTKNLSAATRSTSPSQPLVGVLHPPTYCTSSQPGVLHPPNHRRVLHPPHAYHHPSQDKCPLAPRTSMKV